MSQSRTAPDPTKAILSESGLDGKYLCDYVINVATGCSHGCRFCYVPATPNIRTRGTMLKEHVDVDDGQAEWGQYVLYRDGSDSCPACGHDSPIRSTPEYECAACGETWFAPLTERLPGILERKRTWRRTEKGCGVVGVSFHTDCFMDKRAAEITIGVVEALADAERSCRILTRNPLLAAHYLETFREARPYVTVGSSIPSFDSDELHALEPNAPPVEARLQGLQRFADAGVPVYVSMSPTYPTIDTPDVIDWMMERFAEFDPSVVFHESINPRGANFDMTVSAARAAGKDRLADSLDRLHDRDAWLHYACQHFRWVQEAGERFDVPVHLWPDKLLIKQATGRDRAWLEGWRDRQSPEPFANRDTPTTPPPLPPASFSWE